MQQAALAPASHPHNQLPSAQESASSAEQSSLPMNPTASSKQSNETSVPQHTMEEEMLINTALRAHLLPHIQVGPSATPEAKPASSASPHDLNIDPAISGVGVTPPPPPPQQIQQQVQVQSPGVNNMAMVMGQAVPQGMPQGMPQSIPQGMPQGMPQTPQRMSMEQHSGAEDTPESASGKGRGGKRELSTSKRAAQNRAAQRAFRQRKEGYIKKLEEQVRDFAQMQESYKQIQSENYQLRDYIIALQSRLIESQGEDAVPPPPLPLLTLANAPPSTVIDPNVQHQMVQQQQQHQVAVPQTPPPQQHAPPAPMAPAASQAPTANMGGIPAPQAPQLQSQQVAMTADMGNGVATKRGHDDETFLQSIAQGATAGNGFLQQQQGASPIAKRLKNEYAVSGADQELMLAATSGEVEGDRPQSNGS
ncbi:hypothetical protein RUND412_002358 [Rhizina undulata]